MAEFRWPVRVYYEDTDSGGVVYYANYLKFMERARTEWLRSRGLEQDRLREEQGIIFAVRAAEIEFLRPARFNQALEVTARLAEARRASLSFEQVVYPAGSSEAPCCSGRIRIACLDARSFRPRALPSSLLTEILDDD
ncbi:tol-pal system-associated acyl-CoA thioesterase [Thiohalobacter sp. IOR34]|uniref:tol-pal system-associated acyl-CoA thioesterase n=1 Tax=Thiohalobacter sp. IOR34 TaxID=3057176 RepID=UPI0025AEDC30|nr:tol-pal system-associated acyl-CoA thioesterase [Thiohalobacter sp. IOR34]WJW74960.1 tol-pal system-associated acyl-CoA thioesterase [Thiohalobacter sp. IOR34]